MQNTKLYLYAASLMACTGATLTSGAAEPTARTESEPPPLYRPWTVGAEAGSTGLGGSAAWRFADHFGVRAGFYYFQVSENDMNIKSINYDTKIRLMSQPLLLDIYPWKARSFHIGVGLQFNQNRLTGTASDTGTIIIDGQPFPSPLVGTLNLKSEQQLVNPYLSIGGNFFYFDRAHHWAMGGEIGVTYTGDPRVSLTRSGPPSALVDIAVAREEQRVKDYADQFRWWPVAKLTVSYSF